MGRRSRRVLVGLPLAAGGLVLAACAPDGAQPSNVRTLTSESSDSQTFAPTTIYANSPPPSTAQPGTEQAPTPPGDCVAGVVQAMTPDQLAGQVLLVGLDAGADQVPGDVTSAITERHAAGVFLIGRSTRGSGPTASLLSAVSGLAGPESTAGVGLHIAVDQEGGRIQVLRGPGFSDIPAALDQAAGGPSAVQVLAARTAAELKAAGVTMVLAPVADVVPAGTDNQPIGQYAREYGATPETAGPNVAAAVSGFLQGGVTPVVKHFPGLGRASGNTDFTAAVYDDETAPDDPYLATFRAGIAAGAPAVMTTTATYSRIDPNAVASFSPTVIGLLRDQLGFTGMVVSDDLGKAESVVDVPVGDRVVRFVQAGGDLALTYYPAQAAEMTAALAARAASDPGFAARLEDAVTHVVRQKASVGLVAACPA